MRFTKWLGIVFFLGLSALNACAAPTLPEPSATSALTPSAPILGAPTLIAAPPLAALSTPSGAKPNIVFILTDDLDAAEIAFMPKLKTWLTDQGVSFSNFFVNVSLCCPSRATTLRGQYVQNTQIFGNSPPDGGFDKVYQLGLEKATIAVWLQSAGYKTMLAGKYMNGYPLRSNQTYVPPGWNEWYSAAKGDAYGEFNYTLNENGKLVAYGKKPEDYGTDVYARKAIDFIQRTSKEGKPFFVYLAPYAPHGPATPAPRHEKLFAGVQAPRTPNYNETDVSDKPQYIRGAAPLTQKEIASIDDEYRKRLQSLQAVDDAIENIVNTLKASGQLDNTYIFFGSDNGFHLGNHRLVKGKQAPYEEDIRVPMIVRGPNVPAGKSIDLLTGNVDYASTFAEIAGVKVPDFVDGRSLVPLLKGTPPSADQWRTAYLIQHGDPSKRLTPAGNPPRATPSPTGGVLEPPDDPDNGAAGAPGARAGITPFYGLRTANYTYVEYSTGEKELYDLIADPYELQNLAAKADANLLKLLAARLAELRKCAGANCRAIESQALK